MKWKICVVSATRAEYGLLKNTILEIKKHPMLDLQLIVTGTHLSDEFGMTVQEIINDGLHIDERIDILMSGDSPATVSKTMGIASISFADAFSKLSPDFLIILGDRYELIPICSVAVNFHIPIAHISGGEVTSGALDDTVRHCVTKMSYLHFPGCETYRKRIIQLGEDPKRVFNFGDVGVENIMCTKFKTKEEIQKIVELNLDIPTASVTFHPVTLENRETVSNQIDALLSALSTYSGMNFVFTKANADANGRMINSKIEAYVKEHKNAKAFTSLGIVNYLSLLKYCCCIIGNSSSGIVEAPTLKVPTINIGDRQKGRLRAESVIDCNPNKEEIIKAIDTTLSEKFIKKTALCVNPYGEGNTSKEIVRIINHFLSNDLINLKKSFYDIKF